MRKIFVYFAVAISLIIVYVLGKSSQKEVGRYQIYMNPLVRADQLLLDTETGRTWQYTQESKEKYMFWHEIPRDELSVPTEQE